MTRDDFIRRLRAYESGQQWAIAVGALPLLAVYLLVHTRWLKPFLQDHKHLVVALLIVVPLAWLLALARGWKRLGPGWLGLRCSACGASLAEQAAPRDGDVAPCPACGKAAVEADSASR